MKQWNNLYENASNLSGSNKASKYVSYDWLGENNANINTQLMVDKYGIYYIAIITNYNMY